MIAPELLVLRERLEAVGVVVVQEPEHLTIRLPFFCSVRVGFANGRLRFDAYFGVATRMKSTTLRLAAMGLIAVLLTKLGGAYAATLAVVALIAGVVDLIRWTITEQAITRATIIAAAPPLSTAAPASLGEGGPPSAPPRTLDYVATRRPGTDSGI